MSIEWNNLIQIKQNWINQYLNSQTLDRKVKVIVRGYTLKFTGTKNCFISFSQALAEILPEFYFGKSEIEKKGERRALLDAIKVFGDLDPAKDGGYGELILFALVESVLGCPMVASKIPSSFNDQAKGGDGIFIGKYEYSQGKHTDAILIGESKIWQQFAGGLDDALLSIDRFNDNSSSTVFNIQEFIVAKRNLTADGLDPEYLYDCLTPGTTVHSSHILVHPVFIMYETNEVSKIEQEAEIREHAEELIKNYITKRHHKHVQLINEKLEKFPGLKKVYIDFHILPVNNVNSFRHSLYYMVHGTTYNPNNKDSNE